MATREELINYLASLLGGQAYNTDWYYSTSPSELETLRKEAIKTQFSLGAIYDTVTPKYRALGDTNPVAQQMFKYFDDIASGRLTAADIIDSVGEGYFNPGQMQDLRTFEEENKARNKAVQDIELERMANAEIYGLPSPSPEGWMLPEELLSGFMPKQMSGMTELEATQQALRNAQKKYAETQAAYERIVPGETPKTSVQRSPIAVVSAMQAQRRGTPMPKKESKPKEKEAIKADVPYYEVARMGRAGVPRPSSAVKTKEIPAPVDAKTKDAMWARNTAYTMQRAAEMRAQQASTYTQRLAEEIARQMTEKYGTPYDAALKIAFQLAEQEAFDKQQKKSSSSTKSSSSPTSDLWNTGRNIYGKYAP